MILALILIAIYLLSFGVMRRWEEEEYEDAFAVTFEDEHRALLASARWPYDFETDDDPTMG